MSLHLHTPPGAGADKVISLDPTEATGITQCFLGHGVTIILKADRPMTPTTRRHVTVQLAIGQRLGVPDAFHLVMSTFNISLTG
jgi:hypothetical protein